MKQGNKKQRHSTVGCLFACKKEEKNYKAKNSLFIIKLQAIFDKVKSLANIKKDMKAIVAKLSIIKIQGVLNNTAMKGNQM